MNNYEQNIVREFPITYETEKEAIDLRRKIFDYYKHLNPNHKNGLQAFFHFGGCMIK